LNQTVSYSSGGHIGGTPGASLGPVEPGKGLYFDRSELPERFQRLRWTEAEIEAVESGGASLFA
jgi:small subunit ribosomal protein YMR-31